jgi:hypothetical protein
MEECQGRISPRVSIKELRTSLSGNMLCFNASSRHLYTRKGDSALVLDTLLLEVINQILLILFPSHTTLTSLPETDLSNVFLPTEEEESLDGKAFSRLSSF